MMASYQLPGGPRIEGTGQRTFAVPGFGAFTDTTSAGGVSFRSLILSAGLIVVLPIGQESTGKKPLVLLSGELKERATTEGTPVILDNGALRTLAAGETLIS